MNLISNASHIFQTFPVPVISKWTLFFFFTDTPDQRAPNQVCLSMSPYSKQSYVVGGYRYASLSATEDWDRARYECTTGGGELAHHNMDDLNIRR